MQTASTEIYTLSLHDALPISSASCARLGWGPAVPPDPCSTNGAGPVGRHRPAGPAPFPQTSPRSEEHTSELQSRGHLVCRLLLEKKNNKQKFITYDNIIPIVI